MNMITDFYFVNKNFINVMIIFLTKRIVHFPYNRIYYRKVITIFVILKIHLVGITQ